MINSRGNTIQEILSLEIELAENMRCRDKQKALAFQALGAVELAIDFDLITYREFESYIHKITKIL